MRGLLIKEQEAASGYEVERSTSTIYFALIQGYARYRRFDVEPKGCSCSAYAQMRLPCRRLVSVLHVNGSTIDIPAGFHPAYLVKYWIKGLMGVI